MLRVDAIVEDCTKYGVKIKTEKYHQNGIYPIIDQGQEQIAGYTDDKEGLFENVPVIIFGDHTRIVKYVDTPFFLGADGVKVLRAKDQNANYKYLYYLLKNVQIPNTGYNRHFKWLKEAEIDYCEDIQVQQQIVAQLDKVQSIIDARKEELKLLDDLIKSRFIEMFGEINEFKALSELTTKITDGSHLPPAGIAKSDYLMLSSQNIFDELVLDDARYLTKEDFEQEDKRTNIQAGDVLLTIVGTLGRSHVVKNGERFVFQRSVGVIKPMPNVLNGVFLSEYLKTQKAKNQLESNGHGSSQKGIYLQDLKKLLVPVASIESQNQFADFVGQVDKSKQTIQQNIKQLEILEKSLMQKYFG